MRCFLLPAFEQSGEGSIILHQPILPQRLELIDFGVDEGGAVVGDVQIRITRGFADDDEAGFFGGGDVFGGDLDEEAPGCFAEEQFGGGEAALRRHFVERDPQAGFAAEGHFGQGDSEAAFTDVVGTEDGPLLDEVVVVPVGGEAVLLAEVGCAIDSGTTGVFGKDAAAQTGTGSAENGDLATCTTQ